VTPTIWKWISVAVGIIAVLGGIYAKGRHDVQVKFDDFKREIASAAKTQEAKNEYIYKGVRDEYEARLAAVRAYYGRMQYSASGKPVSNAASGANAAASNDLPAYPDLLLQCTETTLMLTSLQKWVENVE